MLFLSMANLTLASRDSYFSNLNTGIKPDTLTSLRTAPLQLATLFPGNDINQAEEDIASYENKGHSISSNRKSRYYLMSVWTEVQMAKDLTSTPGRVLDHVVSGWGWEDCKLCLFTRDS